MTPEEQLIVYDYESLLMGKRLNFQAAFKNNSTSRKEKEAGIIWRYAIEGLLKCTAKEAIVYMTDDVANKLKLNKTYAPLGINESKSHIDFRYFISLAFPEEIKYDIYIATISEYKKVCKQDYSVEGSQTNIIKVNERYPRNFFFGVEGEKHAIILLNYVISQYLSDMSIYELYMFFADTAKATQWLRGKKLYSPLVNLYGKDTIDYLNYSINQNGDYNFYYYLAKANVAIAG